jgi:hypothetical protein
MMQHELLAVVRSLNLTILLVTHNLHEVIPVTPRKTEQVGVRLPGDDSVFERIWDQLAVEMKASC